MRIDCCKNIKKLEWGGMRAKVLNLSARRIEAINKNKRREINWHVLVHLWTSRFLPQSGYCNPNFIFGHTGKPSLIRGIQHLDIILEACMLGSQMIYCMKILSKLDDDRATPWNAPYLTIACRCIYEYQLWIWVTKYP